MTFVPTAELPSPPPTGAPHVAVSAAGGVFPVGAVGFWGSRLDPDDPAVGVIAAARGTAVVRRSGRVDTAGPDAPVVRAPSIEVRAVRRLGGRWWALGDRRVVALDDGESFGVAAGSIDVVRHGEGPVGVDRSGAVRSPDGAVLDDPGGLDGELLGAIDGAEGWWIVARSGTVLARGGAAAHDGVDTSTYPHPLTAVGPTLDGRGLVIATADGRLHARGTPYPGGLPRPAASGAVTAVSPVEAG
ncbi:MAG: hypothetical protein AAGA99_04015 [Actinomycetota bacterium]